MRPGPGPAPAIAPRYTPSVWRPRSRTLRLAVRAAGAQTPATAGTERPLRFPHNAVVPVRGVKEKGRNARMRWRHATPKKTCPWHRVSCTRCGCWPISRPRWLGRAGSAGLRAAAAGAGVLGVCRLERAVRDLQRGRAGDPGEPGGVGRLLWPNRRGARNPLRPVRGCCRVLAGSSPSHRRASPSRPRPSSPPGLPPARIRRRRCGRPWPCTPRDRVLDALADGIS